jgi:cation:H+ antiporter
MVLTMDIVSIAVFILGLVLLTVGAEFMVRGAAKLAGAFGISPLVVGLTIVAYGTSTPELAVSVQSAYVGKGDIALGNVVGSNIFNVLFILGLSALVAPLIVSFQLVRLDVPLMIASSILMTLMALDGTIGRADGVILLALLITYTVWSIRQSRKEQKEIEAEYEKEFGVAKEKEKVNIALQIIFILVGLGLLVLGSQWLVDGAVAIARGLHVSELIIGLTIIAAGTSLPEVATSVVASIRGQRDIAVGNVVGSNIFNILSVLGMASLVAPDGVTVAQAALNLDIPVMLAASIACLPVFFHESRINRWEGGVFLGYYCAYVAYLILDATGHDYLPYFSLMMLGFVVPLTGITLLVVVVRSLKRRGSSKRP